MIMVIDYGMGNIGSVCNMLKKIGAESGCAKNPDELENADKLILPGVGYFNTGMAKLDEAGFTDAINKHAKAGKPVLGICLGMQMLGGKSEEGTLPGLGLIDFNCIRFKVPADRNLKIPHMGWNRVTIQADTPLTRGLTDKERYYFVHSYHAICNDQSNSLMTSEYCYEFTAAVYKDNIYGVQFHPEKSHGFGIRILGNFVKEC